MMASEPRAGLNADEMEKAKYETTRPAMANWRPAAWFTPAPRKVLGLFSKILTSQL
jgi:hypothetical protein